MRYAQRLQVAPRLRDQRADALDRVHGLRELREDRGLVAAAGADLEHAVELAAVARELGHARDDPGLRDRLPAADRQRRVLVGADRERLVDEDVARHRVHRGQHDLVADALLAQALDHARARARRRHADAVEAFASGHSDDSISRASHFDTVAHLVAVA